MDTNTMISAQIELKSIIHDAWAIYARTRDPQDAELARVLEADARELLAQLATPRPKAHKSNKAKKRKAFKHHVRLDAGSPILPQARLLGS